MKLIKNGLLIDPSSQREGQFDLLIEGTQIKDVQPQGSFDSVQSESEIDAKGCWVVPGLIDIHVHLREPGFEWKETVASGSQAAILGGFTGICAMPNTSPVNDKAAVTEFMLERACEAALARVHPIGAVSLGSLGEQMAPLSELRNAGCVAFSDDGEPVYDSGLMRRALEWCLMLGATISCHEEDKALTCGGCMNESALSLKLGLKGMPKVGEDVMVARDIELARATGGKVHFCHVSTARSVELIRRAKHDGIAVSCEVTPHHLVLTEDCVKDYDTYAKMSPPLREQEDVEALISGLVDGTIDAIASDHAPHEDDSKKVEFSQASFGILGLQTNLPLVLELVREKKISALKAIELFSSGPARCFDMDYGSLQKGRAADITVIDPNHKWTLSRDVVVSKSSNSPFYDREFSGIARDVFVNGTQVLDNMKIVKNEN